MEKNKLKQNAITNQKKKKRHDRKLKGKNNKLKQNAVTEEKKKKPHEIALWGGFARKIQETRRRQGNKTQAPTPESYTFKGASRKPQLKDCKLIQDASTKQRKKTRNRLARVFTRWKVLRWKAKMKEKQAQAKRSHQRKEEATRNRFMGDFARKKNKQTMRQEERQGKKTQAPTPKEFI